MRLLETNKVLLAVIVSACHTDLGIKNERISGYYDGEWKWDDIKQNSTHKIIQLGSSDDPFIPIAEMDHIHESLDSVYHKYNDQGHFQGRTSPKILKIVGDAIDTIIIPKQGI